MPPPAEWQSLKTSQAASSGGGVWPPLLSGMFFPLQWEVPGTQICPLVWVAQSRAWQRVGTQHTVAVSVTLLWLCYNTMT